MAQSSYDLSCSMGVKLLSLYSATHPREDRAPVDCALLSRFQVYEKARRDKTGLLYYVRCCRTEPIQPEAFFFSKFLKHSPQKMIIYDRLSIRR